MLRCVPVTSTDTPENPVSLPDMKDWLRLDQDETVEDALVERLIATAARRIEERTNRSFIIKPFDAFSDCAPDSDCPVKLPRSPLVSVTSVKGFTSTDLTDTGGTTMSTSGYYVDTLSEPGRIVPTGSVAWPTATRNGNAFVVRFTAGESTAEAGVSEASKIEIKQLVAKLFEHRGDELETAKILHDYEAFPTDLSLPEWG